MKNRKPEQTYMMSFRCHYLLPDGTKNYTQHRAALPVSDIPRWMDAYKFTHPDCISISLKVWWNLPEDSQKMLET